MTDSRRKGRRYELDSMSWLDGLGVEYVDTNRSGFAGGDLILPGPPTIHLEIKNQRVMDLAGWVDQADRDRQPGHLPAVLHKRRGRTDVGGHYVSMPAWAFISLATRQEPRP